MQYREHRFNSTLVQLKEAAFILAFLFLVMFQFDLSSIKRLIQCHGSRTPSSFNSTLVQLKVFLSGLWVLIQSSFNSTLVQLKVIIWIIIGCYKESFNSTLVQLKVSIYFISLFLLHLFQFYLSSIKRFWRNGRRRERKMFQFYLSSIKRAITNLKQKDYERFQFYLSSIKSRQSLED